MLQISQSILNTFTFGQGFKMLCVCSCDRKHNTCQICDAQKGKQIYFDIYFEDTHAEVDSFKKKIAEEDWDNYDRYVNYFQDFIVKEIDIHLWDWGTRKKIE